MPEHHQPDPGPGPGPHAPRPQGPGAPRLGGPGAGAGPGSHGPARTPAPERPSSPGIQGLGIQGPADSGSANTGRANTAPAQTDPAAAPLRSFQGPVIYNRTAAAAGHTMRVLPDDLLAAAASLTRHTEQSSATPGLRVTAAAAGNPAAGEALAALSDQFAATLAALDADRGAAVHNLNDSARLYQSVETRIRQHMIDTLGPVIAGRDHSALRDPAVPTPRPALLHPGIPTAGTPGGGTQGGSQGGGPQGREPRGSGR